MTGAATPKLRLLRGGLDHRCRFGETVIAVVPLEAPAPPLDAVVVEQDSHALLAVDSQLPPPEQSVAQLSDELQAFVPNRCGEVVVRRGEPLQLLAIVHDLDQTPSWREEWIVSALNAALALAGQRQLKRIGMPALGTLHGHFSQARFIELLAAAVAHCTAPPAQIWLGVPRERCGDAIAQLRRHCAE